ncbi:MAG: serine/threonine protein kinase [Planctomycetaceae bacterium]|nr:serine/threonine protein kinase [Planctomycetaceae bacterium]
MNSAPSISNSQITSLDLTGKYLAGGRYEVQRQLGGGSMGFVYRAIDHNLDSTVVIKTPTIARLQDENFLWRFQAESRFLVKLRHPHIISILDVGIENNLPFFVMQYVAGGALEDKQKRNGRRVPMSRKSLPRWLPQIASALDFMHAQGCVHRDVKPGNILFDKHGNPYLSDFGLSKVLADDPETDSGQTAAGAVIGTPNYVAPELVLGREFDGHVDQYSLAITVFEVLTGKVPFQGPSASATMVNQVSQKPPNPCELNPKISTDLAKVILKGMAKKPENRFESCSEFADAILARLEDVNDSSAERWITSSEMQLNEAPQFVSYGKSKVKQNRVACKGCSTKLVVKPDFAGKKGKCNTCGMRMAISKNLKTVEFFVPFDNNTKVSESADHQFSMVFSQRAFGMEFDAQSAMMIVASLILVIVIGSIAAFTFSLYDRDQEQSDNMNRTKIYSE